MKAPILLPLVLGMSTSAFGDVFISEYVEGSSNNKAIEIYNPTEQSVALTGYTLSIYSNGKVVANTNIELTGSLDAGSTLVIADDSSSAELLAKADVQSGQGFFNGNDAIVLTNALGNVVDSFGKLGTDPGSYWGSGDATTKDHTLVRKASVTSGDTTPDDEFDLSEWDAYPIDTFSYLGSHNTQGGGNNGGGDNGDGGSLEGVCTNCPDLDKVADASTFVAADYYAAVQAEIDANSATSVIRQVMSQTISGQRVLTYTQVWTALTETDEDPNNPDNILLIYSGNSIPKANNGSGAASSEPDFWNREHSWPKSHGFSSDSNEAYTDIQHLRPADITVNSSRNNLDFDNSDAPLSEAPENRIDSDSFEPRDAVKGDVARMMMYMDVRYEGAAGDVTPNLVLVNNITSGSTPDLGKLCTLLAWSSADPVDQTEMDRQNAIYEYQGNRNPFVDHPEWVDVVYGATNCDGEGETPEPEPEPEPEPQPEPTGNAPIMITGVYDGPLSGGTPKGVELFVTQNIADLSMCGLGSANNGGGSDGEEFTFPAVSATAGQFIYVASEDVGFSSFFGFAPDYTAGAMSINGDDAIELFCGGEVVDLFGDINTDGTGEAWDHLDGWAYRIAGGASATFDVANWSFSGTNALDGESDNATAATPFPLASYAPPATELFFSEYIEGGSFNKAVEIANLTAADVDLSGYVVEVYVNGGTTAGQTIELSGTVAAGDVYVVAHSSASSEVQGVSDLLTGALSFNGDDAVVLRKDGQIIDSIGRVGEDPGSYWEGGDVRTQDRTLVRKASVTAGDVNAEDAFDPSLEWDVYPKDTFDYLGFYGASNGGGDNGGGDELGMCAETATFISAVQGEGSESPMSGQTVIVEGVVTHIAPAMDGFWVQEEAADSDGNDLTSEGVFVSAASLVNTVSVGEVVRLAGTVSESYGRTTVTASSEALNCGTDSVAPVAITLPMSSSDAFEAYEGMLVTSDETWVISNIYSYSAYGEIWVSTERLFNPTQLYLPGSQEAADLAAANALDKLIIDDNADGLASEWLLPLGEFSPYNPIRSGDLISGMTGVMDYGYSAYRVRPTTAPTLISDNYREDAPVVADGNLKVASFNVLNLFNGNGAEGGFPTSRGAESYVEYQRQQAKIVNALKAIDADVVGLLELENDGYGADSTIAQLVDALNAEMGAGMYAYIDAGVEKVGTDEITAGIIYRPSVVSPVGGVSLLTSANSIVDGDGPLFLDTKNRPSLAQLFTHTASGKQFAIDVNHLKSKGSSCGNGDDSAEQGNCNLTRTRAATAVMAWLAQTYQDTAVIMLGDYNAYGKEDPVQVVTNAGFADTVSAVHGNASYSYSYGGLSGTLDYQFANSTAMEWLVDVTEWHINSDEPLIFDYNNTLSGQTKDVRFLNELPFRASDHDPVIATYQLEAEVTIPGDWDGDNDIDNDDIRGFMVALFSGQSIDMAFDLNNDRRVNARDVAAMRKMCTRRGCATEGAQSQYGRAVSGMTRSRR